MRGKRDHRARSVDAQFAGGALAHNRGYQTGDPGRRDTAPMGPLAQDYLGCKVPHI